MDPEHWSLLEPVLGTEILARVCGPFDDALSPARLEYLVDVVARLRRRYDAEGVREWFLAPSGADGRRPVDVLGGAWDPAAQAPAGLSDGLAPARP